MKKKAPGVFVPTRFVEEVGLPSAHLLAQIVYWFGKASAGKSQWIVEKFGGLWLAHSRAQLGQETGLTENQIKGALTNLKHSEFIDVQQHLFEGKTSATSGFIKNVPIGSAKISQLKCRSITF